MLLFKATDANPLPRWKTTVYGEGGIGYMNGATVTILDGSSRVFGPDNTNAFGQVSWAIYSGFSAGNYTILVEYPAHANNSKVSYYSGYGDQETDINIGPVD